MIGEQIIKEYKINIDLINAIQKDNLLVYAAQWKHAMDMDIPNFEELLDRGELLPIREWLNAKYLADYLKEKYTKVYQLQ